MPKKLLKYARESDLMNISIKYGKETFNFNLYLETKIVLNSTHEAKTQPTSYAFLTMLNEGLAKDLADKENILKRLYGRLYLKFKEINNPKTGRPHSDDAIRERVITNKKFKDLEDQVELLRYNKARILACVRAFEQRQNLIQTIAANNRKEKS